MRIRCGTLFAALALALSLVLAGTAGAGPGPQDGEGSDRPARGPGPGARGRVGGLPPEVLKEQSKKRIEVPTPEEAAAAAWAAAAKEAEPLLRSTFHEKGRRLLVPGEFAGIQAALDAAKAGDTVVVKAGVYHEQLRMKDGVRLVSEAGEDGDEPVPVTGARLRLPRRTVRTVLDGSKAKPSRHGMIDFEPGTGRNTIVDGFTIRALPDQDHHVPGHAHGLNVRGASPVITNCIVRGNGSTGIGNHVVFADQGKPIDERDFRSANVRHASSAVIYRNVIEGNLGLGIGCNHLSAPFILGNEVFGNDDSALGGSPSPGIGAKHGASPTVVGNMVHDNAGGGILCRRGDPQGAHPIDRRSRPTFRANVVYSNGNVRPAISCSAAGTKEEPARLEGNRVFEAGSTGLGVAAGSFAVVRDNLVSGTAGPGIAVNASTVLELDRNQVSGTRGAGVVLVAGTRVLQMKGNAVFHTKGPRYMVRLSTIGSAAAKPSEDDD
jgi:hypothetical protein